MTRPADSVYAAEGDAEYVFTLYVAGDEPNSVCARRNIFELCREYAPGRCHLKVVDVLDEFEEATKQGVLLTPTLIRVKPEPVVRIIGNLSNREKAKTVFRLEVG